MADILQYTRPPRAYTPLSSIEKRSLDSDLASVRSVLLGINSIESDGSQPEAAGAIESALTSLRSLADKDHTGVAWNINHFYDVWQESTEVAVQLASYHEFYQHESTGENRMGVKPSFVSKNWYVRDLFRSLQDLSRSLVALLVLLEA